MFRAARLSSQGHGGSAVDSERNPVGFQLPDPEKVNAPFRIADTTILCATPIPAEPGPAKKAYQMCQADIAGRDFSSHSCHDSFR